MATATSTVLDSKLTRGPGKIGVVIFLIVLSIGVVYAGSHLVSDLAGVRTSSAYPFLLLTVALLIALGFEFVNGFHDTANAVATVIYTHTLEPHIAVVWNNKGNALHALERYEEALACFDHALGIGTRI